MSGSARPSTPSGSSVPDDSPQFVEPDDQTQRQSRKQSPGSCASPLVNAVPDTPEQHDGANQCVTGTCGRSCASDVVLERFCRAPERKARLLLSHARLNRTSTRVAVSQLTDRRAVCRAAHQYTLTL